MSSLPEKGKVSRSGGLWPAGGLGGGHGDHVDRVDLVLQAASRQTRYELPGLHLYSWREKNYLPVSRNFRRKI